MIKTLSRELLQICVGVILFLCEAWHVPTLHVHVRLLMLIRAAWTTNLSPQKYAFAFDADDRSMGKQWENTRSPTRAVEPLFFPCWERRTSTHARRKGISYQR